jgi:hypothetical protein
MPNIDALKKVYRKHTASWTWPNLSSFSLRGKAREATRSPRHWELSLLWVHLFREITDSGRLNILTQTHPNHIGLLYRAAEKLAVGGEDLFEAELVNELTLQIKTATLVNSSVAGPSAISAPGKPRRLPPSLHDS